MSSCQSPISHCHPTDLDAAALSLSPPPSSLISPPSALPALAPPPLALPPALPPPPPPPPPVLPPPNDDDVITLDDEEEPEVAQAEKDLVASENSKADIKDNEGEINSLSFYMQTDHGTRV